MLKIGDLAKQTGVTVGTLRYYENLGLIEPSQRAKNGYRYYADTAIFKIQFIKKAQALQFSLTEIKQILEIQEKGNPACITVKKILNEKIAQANSEIQHLHEFKVELEHYRDRWSERSLDQPDLPEFCSLIDEVPTPLSSNDSAIAISSTIKQRFS